MSLLFMVLVFAVLAMVGVGLAIYMRVSKRPQAQPQVAQESGLPQERRPVRGETAGRTDAVDVSA